MQLDLRRLALEQGAQLLYVGTTFLDRILIAGVLYRAWGPAAFEDWSTCVATAGLFAMFEFGFNMYYSNRLTAEYERGGEQAARRALAQANLLFLICGLAGVATVAALYWLDLFPKPQAAAPEHMPLAVGALCLATLARVPMLGIFAMFRAHKRFGVLTMTMALAELARISLVLSLVLVFKQSFLVTILTASAFLVVSHALAPALLSIRLFKIEPRLAAPPLAEAPETLSKSTSFFLQSMSNLLLTNAPVLFLGAASAAAGPLAIFVLLRTLTNLPRMMLQALSIVPSNEFGRLLSRGDDAAAFALVEISARAFSTLSGVAAGLIIGVGPDLLRLWTGEPSTFRLDYVLAASLPMMLGGVTVLYHNLLITANTPHLSSAGRFIQLGLAIGAFYLLPLADPVMKVFLALSIAEIVGYGAIATYAVTRAVARANWAFQLRIALFSLGVSAVVALFGWAARAALPGDDVPAAIARVSGVVLASIALTYFVGLTKNLRRLVTRRVFKLS